ncbi:hypothetical protein EUGRSUZ_C02239 [Eucalyptus grandis]|uniref:Uncharacterized protein n=2 Tax=Eucalyptus grandis TaxID=71139 RepID=A0ACC3LGW2_EUCGR|nr:hypothetical protein EUGRSUZ_C02239 [Eucalyptus grandis]
MSSKIKLPIYIFHQFDTFLTNTIEKAKTHFTVQISNTEDARLIKVLCSKIQFLQLHLHQGERSSQSSRLCLKCVLAKA